MESTYERGKVVDTRNRACLSMKLPITEYTTAWNIVSKNAHHPPVTLGVRKPS